jgi:hypothetical protein
MREQRFKVRHTALVGPVVQALAHLEGIGLRGAVVDDELRAAICLGLEFVNLLGTSC